MDNAYNGLIDPNGLQQFHSGVILSVSYLVHSFLSEIHQILIKVSE